MNINSEKEAQQKRPYVKPKVTKVDLTPEEVALGACKTAGGSPSTSKSPNKPCRVCGLATGS